MNKNLEKLYCLAKKDSRLIIGLMSGTSMDGLDVALCSLTGNGLSTTVNVLQFESVMYTDSYREKVEAIAFQKNADVAKLCLLNEWIGIEHGFIVNRLLQKWNINKTAIDLIASHGQTVYHVPQYQHTTSGNGTLQIGDGDHIARTTGIITISDFRQRHIAAGGEGAPLAAYGDYILFSKKGEPVVLVNIGGIANFTLLDGRNKFEDIICSDTGPGNILMDGWMKKNYPGKRYDENGMLAQQGRVNEELLSLLKADDFFKLLLPKTTGPELFNQLYVEAAIIKTGRANFSGADVMATLNTFTSDTIAGTLLQLPGIKECKVFISGGGVHNRLLMENLRNNLPGILIFSTGQKNVDPDAKEAILFAILANECIAGNAAETFGEGSKKFPAISMGKISFPD